MEFQSVIFSGPGRHLHPISTTVPKPLLPIGNKPMIEYALKWCAQAAFASITVAVDEQEYDAVNDFCLKTSDIKAKLVKIPHSTPSGAVLPLLHANGELNPHQDIVVVPCDFITDVDPESLISTIRQQDDNIAVSGVYYRNTLETLETKTLEPDVLFHAVSDDGTELLVDAYERKAVSEAKVLKPRMAMLWRFPEVIATMDLMRSSIFFLKRHVLEFDDIDFNKTFPKVITDIARRTWRHREMRERVSLLKLPPTTLFVRANILSAYTEANRYFLRLKARHAQSQPQEDRKREPNQAAIGNDSMVGANTVVGERSSVKRTAIGNNCTIGKKCRLNGCVILDNVTIDNEVMLENCIIGQGAVIESKSKLNGCSIEGKYVVVSETEAKNEVLKGLSMAAMSDDEFSDVYSASTDESSSEGDMESDEDDSEEFDDDEDDIFDRS